VFVARYVQELGAELQPPMVKQHLAAIRMLFDYLVTGQIVPLNPAAVKGPKYVIKVGKTPVLSAGETRELLAAIDTSQLIGLRDRALIGVMVFSFVRVSAVVGMNVEGYFQKGKRWWFRFPAPASATVQFVSMRWHSPLVPKQCGRAGVQRDSATSAHRATAVARSLFDNSALQRRSFQPAVLHRPRRPVSQRCS
jgi:hypothetical protein